MARRTRGSGGWGWEDTGLLLAAVIVAVIVWYNVYIDTQSQQQLEVPVEVRMTEPGFLVLDQSPRRVSVTLRGPRERLGRLPFDRLRVVHTLPAGVEPGTRQVAFSAGMLVPEPEGLQVEFGSASLRLDLDREVSREVRVVPIYDPPEEGTIPEGMISVPEPMPAFVWVKGPARVLEREGVSIRTVPIPPEVFLRRLPYTTQVELLQEIDGYRVSCRSVVELAITLKPRAGAD